MVHCEKVTDPATGEVLGVVCVREPLTDEERAALVERVQYMRRKRGTIEEEDKS